MSSYEDFNVSAAIRVLDFPHTSQCASHSNTTFNDSHSTDLPFVCELIWSAV